MASTSSPAISSLNSATSPSPFDYSSSDTWSLSSSKVFSEV